MLREYVTNNVLYDIKYDKFDGHLVISHRDFMEFNGDAKGDLAN